MKAEFYLFICSNRFYVFNKNDKKPVSFDGNLFYEYETNKFTTALETLISRLLENNNMDDRGSLLLYLITSTDAVKNKAARSKFDFIKVYDISKLLYNVLQDLSSDPKNHAELGINYDNNSCVLENGDLKFGEFNLLAKLIEPETLLKYLN